MGNTIARNFTFGAPVAEYDQFLADAFFDSSDYLAIEAYDDSRRFIIGRTGSGKSACFKQLEKRFPSKVVRVDPQELALHYILNIGVVDVLQGMDVHLEPFFRALWTHVIMVAVIRHKTSRANQSDGLSWLRSLFQSKGRREAIAYVDSYGETFWQDTETIVKQVVERLQEKINNAAQGLLPSWPLQFGVKQEREISKVTEIQRNLRFRFQTIVNESQIPRLNEVVRAVDQDLLGSPREHLYLVIDDLDKDWVESNLAQLLIRCLFDVVLDLTHHIRHLKILVALRTNIFQKLDFARNTQQEEKHSSLVLRLRWEPSDLKKLLEERVHAASIRYKIDPPWTLGNILTQTSSQNAVDPLNYILERTFLRPRDVISYSNECLTQAVGKETITMNDIHNAQKRYSEERLTALRDEWKDPYRDIDKVLLKFQNASSRLNREELTAIFNEIALLTVDESYEGKEWLSPMCKAAIDSNFSSLEEWYKYYGDLFGLLFKISFLGVAKKQGTRDSRSPRSTVIYSYLEEERAQRATDHLESISSFYIHPAFHHVLNIAVLE